MKQKRSKLLQFVWGNITMALNYNFRKELGHWHKDCPKRKDQSKEEAKVQPVLSVSTNMSPTKIYVTAEVNGEPVRCLLDSGCERSVIAAGLAPEAILTPSQYSLFAANKASLRDRSQ